MSNGSPSSISVDAPTSPGLSGPVLLRLGLRVLMEVGIVLALGYWGFHTGNSATTETLLGIGAPVLAFGFWGAVDFHQAGGLAEPLRLTQELLVSGLAAGGLYAAGQPFLGVALALLSLVYHALVYLLGARLLERRSISVAK